jgi:hypothetical protein
MISTFEPARTDLKVGTVLAKGDEFASVDGKSDHCDNVCVHWGIKKADTYEDPEKLVMGERIVLKPL